MTKVDEKEAARKAGFARRKAAHGHGLDAEAQLQLRAALSTMGGRVLAGYMPIRTEVDPLPVMADWHGTVGVPIVNGPGQPLRFHRWTPDAAMVEGAFGALIPAVIEVTVPDVLIVPLVAFDRQGYRLGYGGGFYDRTLEGLRQKNPTAAIGFAYDAQYAKAVPTEPTDQRLDAIVTERGVQWFGS